MFFSGFADEAASDLDGQIKAIKEIGWKHIELRTINNTMIHNLSTDQIKNLKEKLEENDITCFCLESDIGNWRHSIEEPFETTKILVEKEISLSKILGIKNIRIMGYEAFKASDGSFMLDQKVKARIKRIKWICSTLADNGKQALLENCFGYNGLCYQNTLELIDTIPGLKLIFDTGNPSISEDINTPFPYKLQSSLNFFNNVKDHVVHIHIKDSYMDKKGNKVFTFPGEGNGQIYEILAIAKQSGYDGGLCIEPHMKTIIYNPENNAPKEEAYSNFIEYGKRLEKLYNSL